MVIEDGRAGSDPREVDPFASPAGQMLDKMLANVLKVPRDQICFARVLMREAPAKDDGYGEELAHCRSALLRKMGVVQPKVVLILGGVACRATLDDRAQVARLRGRWRSIRFPGGEARAMPSFHPAYLLRHPGDKRKSFDDLKAVRTALVSLRA
jgi:DNA polymerase